MGYKSKQGERHIKVTFLFVLVFMMMGSLEILAGQKLVIAGTGDSQELLRVLGKKFEKLNPEMEIEIPDSVGTLGGIRALKKGAVKLARTARPLKLREKHGLSEKLFARSAIVFAVHPSLYKVDNLTTEQVLGIYSGKYRNWSDVGGPQHKIYVVDREAGDSTRIVLEKLFSGFNKIKSVAIIKYTTQDAVDAVENHNFTIGFFPTAPIVDRALISLSLDGIAPDSKNIKQGKYRYFVPFYIVSKGELTGIAKQFVDYLYSEKARNIMKEKGVVPVK